MPYSYTNDKIPKTRVWPNNHKVFVFIGDIAQYFSGISIKIPDTQFLKNHLAGYITNKILNDKRSNLLQVKKTFFTFEIELQF